MFGSSMPVIVALFTAVVKRVYEPVRVLRGRALDYSGFEVKNLEEFCTKLEADGVKLAVPYRKGPALGIAHRVLCHLFPAQ
jgi:hypothetical protein